MSKFSAQRYGALDFIKFLAAVLIIFHHFQGDFAYENTFIKFSGGQFFFGYIVELFFMISGFFIGMKNQKNQKLPFGQYMSSRLMRLMPMAIYSTVIFMILVAVYKIFFDVWCSCGPLSPIMILKGLSLVYCGGAFAYQNIEPNCILWYLCVLLICYAVYWIILFVAKKLKISPRFLFVAMVFFGVAIISYSINLPFANSFTARGYISFFFGVVLVQIFGAIDNKKIISLVSLVVLIIFVLYGIFDIELLFGTGADQQFTLVFILYPAIIGLFTNSKFLDSAFDNKFVQTLGGISFEMYLCQYHVFMLIHILEAFGVVKFPRSDIGMIMVTAIIIVVSLLTYFLVEKPISNIIKNRTRKNV